MGGAHKLLLPFGDGPLIVRSVERAIEAGVEDLAVVIGPAARELRAALAHLPVEFVENSRFETGQASSVTAAIDWAEPRSEGLMLLLGDEPSVDPYVIRTAVEAWIPFPRAALRVRYRDRLGHPVIVPLPVDPDRRPRGDTGMRDLLSTPVELAVDRRAPIDVDTEEDYRVALARLRR